MDFVRRLVPTVIRRRYAVKFGIALLVLGLSVAAIGLVATGAMTDQAEDRVHEDRTSFVGQEAQSLQMWNEQNEQTIMMIGWSDSIEQRDVGAIEYRFLNWETQLDVDIFQMDYVDTESETILTSTNAGYRGESIEAYGDFDESAFEEASESVPWVSKPYVAQDALGQETAVVTYVLDVPRQDDRAIVYTADLEAFTTRFQDEDRVTTMVLDADDDVMLDTVEYGEDYATLGASYESTFDVTELARTDGPGSQRITDAPSGALAHEAYEFDHDDYVVGYALVRGTDWVVVVHESADDAYGPVATVDQYGTYATLFGVLLIGMVGTVLGRNTSVAIDRLTDKAGRMEEGDLDVDLETKRIDNIGRLYVGFSSMRDALREQIEEAQRAREEAEAERERVQQINDDLQRAAQEYGTVMGNAADGDLTVRTDIETDNETMAQIGADFNEMLAEIEETVAELNQFATEVATASEEVTASSEEVRSASEQVTESIQEISDGSERQNESLQSVNDEMSALSTTTEEIAASSNEVADIAARTVDTGQQGRQAAQEAIAAMDEIETESEQAVTEIRRLEAEVQQIDELINAISEIAKQTNMLALNANIEASRSAAGDEGEGFAVVAQEVKALSEDVKDAANEAEERLESIREQTTQSAEEVEKTSAEIDVAGAQVEQAVRALEEIAEYAQETNTGVQEISAATEEQAASTQEVVAMVDEAAIISEETTAEAENVAAAAEEQTTALTEVSRSASDLANQAAQLSEALDRFDTDVDPRDDGGGDGALSFDEGETAGTIEFDVETGVEGADGATPLEPVDEQELDSEPETEFELQSDSVAESGGDPEADTEFAGASNAVQGEHEPAETDEVSLESEATWDVDDAPASETPTIVDEEGAVGGPADEDPLTADDETGVEPDAEQEADADGTTGSDATEDDVFRFGDVNDDDE